MDGTMVSCGATWRLAQGKISLCSEVVCFTAKLLVPTHTWNTFLTTVPVYINLLRSEQLRPLVEISHSLLPCIHLASLKNRVYP
jgi:hypothetical protein